MMEAPVSYGDDQYTSLSELREVVWEISGGQCEHPVTTGYTAGPMRVTRCPLQGVELAHIVPRGHGGSRYRNTVNNTMAACRVHARSTDDLSDPEWDHVVGWRVRDHGGHHDHLLTKRQALTRMVNVRRKAEGWAL